MTAFIKGKELCRGFFEQVAKPILDRGFPGLVYSAGLLGYGSDVLGYDDVVSTDHMWGPRFYLFLREEDKALQPHILEAFSQEFPYTYRGYSVHFSRPDPNDKGIRHAEAITQGQVDPLIFFHTFEEYLDFYLGTHYPETLTDVEWLSLPEHHLLALAKGEFYVDMLHCQERLEPLRFYPENVWLYLVASCWSLVAEEQAFVKRCASVGDSLGSALVCGRIAERLMRLCFLYCRQYAPYSKWFGTAFQQLPIPQELKDAIGAAVAATDTTQREDNLVRAQQLTAQLHNSLGVTEAVPAEIVPYFGRDIKVIYADKIAHIVRGHVQGALASAPLIGSLSQVANFTTLYEDIPLRRRVEGLYQD